MFCCTSLCVQCAAFGSHLEMSHRWDLTQPPCKWKGPDIYCCVTVPKVNFGKEAELLGWRWRSSSPKTAGKAVWWDELGSSRVRGTKTTLIISDATSEPWNFNKFGLYQNFSVGQRLRCSLELILVRSSGHVSVHSCLWFSEASESNTPADTQKQTARTILKQ